MWHRVKGPKTALQARLIQVSEEATCPYPGCEAEATDVDSVWERRGPAEDPAVARSQLLVATARAGAQQQPCLWLRGMPPAEWGATPEAPTEEQFAVVGSPEQRNNGELVSWEGGQRHYYTDGSGSEHSKEPALRRCAWSYVALEHSDSNKELGYGAHGPLLGKLQTVARAELQGVIMVAKLMAGDVVVHTDNLAVFLACKGTQVLQHTGPNGDQWREPHLALQGRAGTFQVLKVKARITQEEFGRTSMEPKDFRGNALADVLAEEGDPPA